MPQAPRPDELPQGVPARLPAAARDGERNEKGQFTKGNRSASSAGGRARKERVEHLQKLGAEGLLNPPVTDKSDPKQVAMQKDLAAHFKRGSRQLRAEQRWLMQTVGGGVLDPMSAAELRNAVTKETLGHLLLENPRIAGSMGKTVALADKLLTAARGHRLTALELSARAAMARGQQGSGPRIDVQSIDVSETLRELLAPSTSTDGSTDDE